MTLPADPASRKNAPVARGVLDYFPDALFEVATVSKAGNDQHHPDKPLHWDRAKSSDHADCIIRHLADRGKRDTDGMLHSAKVAWRALALLQTELEAARSPGLFTVTRGANRLQFTKDVRSGQDRRRGNRQWTGRRSTDR